MPDTPLQMQLVTTPDLALRFKSMSAHEELSRLFELQVVATCDDATIAADDLLGTPASVSLEHADGSKRWWSGIIAAFGIDGHEGRVYTYRLVLRPWLWLLTRSADVRIFQEMSTPDIVKEIFGKYTGTVTDELSGSYAPRTYCVQYRESDFNFVSRLMEDVGIFYYFRHAEGQHELVLADAPGTHVASTGFDSIDYAEDEQALAERQAINEWHMRHEIQTGKVLVSDYNFETPNTSLLSAPATSSRSHAEADREVYDYPGIHAAKGDGDNRAKLRLDEASARFTRYSGQGNTPGLAVGAKFTLADHPRDDQNADYVVLSTQIDMTQAGGAESGGDDTLFLCRFTAQAMSDAFRPARITRKPTVAGPQTALVVGGGDPGDIETDEYGRIKVQFHWDRVGEKNADSSCWLRVASGGAGKGWGMISVPRIGHEVVVAFLEGDPDQPLVVGSVYNADVVVPYELPANATVSTIKSRSKLGAAAEFNELRFEDKAGSEYVLFQAQKDRLEFVEDTFRSEIGVDEHRSVKQHRKEKIDGELHQQVAKVVKQKFSDAVHVDVADKMLQKTGDVWSLDAGADITGKSGAAISLQSAADMHLKIGGNWGGVAGQNVHVKGGMNVVIEAGVEITLKAGGSFVTIGPAGVAIKGAMVMINSGGAAGSGNGANPVAPTAPEAPDDPEAPEDPAAAPLTMVKPVDEQALEDAAWNGFVQQLADHLAGQWPAMPERLADRYPAFVDMAVQQAAQRGLSQAAGVARYVNLWFVWGPAFHDKPGFEWAQAILAAPHGREWLTIHQLVQRSLAELQRLPNARIAPQDVAAADARVLDAFAPLGRRGAMRRPDLLPLPRKACDLEVVELRVLDDGWQQEYVLAGGVAGEWQRSPAALPPPLRVGVAPALPMPPLLALLSPQAGQGPQTRLQVRVRTHAVCDGDVHPGVAFGGAHGRWSWAGHETRAVSWPVATREQPLPPAGPATAIAEETSPELHLLEIDSCGLRDDGDAVGTLAARIAVWPAAQWWLEVQRAPPAPQPLLPGRRDWTRASTRCRVERDGAAQDAAPLRQRFEDGLDAATSAGLQTLAAAWESVPGLTAPRLDAALGLLVGRAAVTWGWRLGPQGLAAAALMRLVAALDMDAIRAELEFGGEIAVGGARSRIALKVQGAAPWRHELRREAPQPGLAELLLPATARWSLPFELALTPLAGDDPALLQQAGPVAGALVGEAGLRPCTKGVSGWEWFVGLRVEPVTVALASSDPLLGTARRQLALLPAVTLVDWSL